MDQIAWGCENTSEKFDYKLGGGLAGQQGHEAQILQVTSITEIVLDLGFAAGQRRRPISELGEADKIEPFVYHTLGRGGAASANGVGQGVAVTGLAQSHAHPAGAVGAALGRPAVEGEWLQITAAQVAAVLTKN